MLTPVLSGVATARLDAYASLPIRTDSVDYEVVVIGVAGMLADCRDRVVVVELDAGLPVLSEVDVILYDTFGRTDFDALDPRHTGAAGQAKVVVFTWNLRPDAVAQALAQGAAGYLSEALSASEIVDAVEAIHNGEIVVRPNLESTDPGDRSNWPGEEAGLTYREAEILAFITQGLSNQEIAVTAFLSVNSVKSCIRNAYRKIGVQRRSQAVRWGLQHGLVPDTVRRDPRSGAPT